MNKYMGFYELKALNVPTVPWKLFSPETVLDEGTLWTVRVATEGGDDLNLPRAVGVDHEEAWRSGMSFFEEYRNKGVVIYYPYFFAEKSGVLDINSQRTVIEAVEKDLWNLVTYGRKNVTVIIPSDSRNDLSWKSPNISLCSMKQPESGPICDISVSGDASFLAQEEIKELMRCGAVIRGRFRDDISEGSSILAEWSYAYNSSLQREPIGSRYLVFYELREIQSF